MGDVVELDPPNLNSGRPWSRMDDFDLRWMLEKKKYSIEATASFLRRTRKEVRERACELSL